MDLSYEKLNFNGYTLKQKLLIVCTIIYLFTLMVFVENEDTLIYSKIAFLITVVVALINIHEKYLTTHDVLIFIFVMLCLASTMWSPLPNKSLEMGITLAQLFAMFVVLRMGFRNFGNEKIFVWIITVAGLAMCLYYLSYYGIPGYIGAMTGSVRLGSDFENTNTIGGASAFVFIGTVYLGLRSKKIWYLIAVIPAIVMLGAGSRTAIVVALGGLAIMLLNYMFRERKNGAIKKGIVIIIVVGAVIYLVTHVSEISFLHSTYTHFKTMFDVISGKSALQGSTAYRMGMIEVGLDIFKTHPIVGNGINATKIALNSAGIPYTVLHDNYVELLADVGLIGFLSYYGVYFLSIKAAIRQINKSSFFPLIMLIMMLIIDIGGVTYYMQRNYLFLIFVTIALENDQEVGQYARTKRFVFGSRS